MFILLKQLTKQKPEILYNVHTNTHRKSGKHSSVEPKYENKRTEREVQKWKYINISMKIELK